MKDTVTITDLNITLTREQVETAYADLNRPEFAIGDFITREIGHVYRVDDVSSELPPRYVLTLVQIRESNRTPFDVRVYRDTTLRKDDGWRVLTPEKAALYRAPVIRVVPFLGHVGAGFSSPVIGILDQMRVRIMGEYRDKGILLPSKTKNDEAITWTVETDDANLQVLVGRYAEKVCVAP